MEEVIKKRKINVEGMTCEGCEKKIEESVGGLEGVKEIRADKKGEVFVKYDLMKVKLKDIEEKIRLAGYKIKEGMFGKMKRDMLHGSEDTEYENMKRPDAPCCSNPPDAHFGK